MTDTITLPRSELQAAYDALTSEDIVCSGCTGGSVGNMCCREQQWDAAKAIRARLAQQEEKLQTPHEMRQAIEDVAEYLTNKKLWDKYGGYER